MRFYIIFVVKFHIIETLRKILVRIGILMFALILSVYVMLHFSGVQTSLVRYFSKVLSERLDTRVAIDKVKYSFFDELQLKGVLVEDLEGDTLLYVEELDANIDELGFLWSKRIDLDLLRLSGSEINLKMVSEGNHNFSFLLDLFQKEERDSVFLWNLACRDFELQNFRIHYQSDGVEGNRNYVLERLFFRAEDFVCNDDSLSFSIREFSFKDQAGFSVEKLGVDVRSKNGILELKDLSISSGESSIEGFNLRVEQGRASSRYSLNEAIFRLNLGEIKLAQSSLAHFFPQITHPSGEFYLGGEISGRLDSIRGENLEIRRGEKTGVKCNFEVTGLPDFNTAYYHLQLHKSAIDFVDMQGLMSSRVVSGNAFLNRLLRGVGVVKYDGSFEGKLNDFEARGVFETNYGLLDGYLIFKPSTAGGVRADGELRASGFDLGGIVGNEFLGTTNFNGRLDAELDSHRKFIQARVEGVIDSLYFNNYCYRAVTMNGLIKRNHFEGELSVNDENLQMYFSGLANANAKDPNFAFDFKVEQANLQALNLMKNYKLGSMALDLHADFNGSDYSNLVGEVSVPSGFIATEFDTLRLDSIHVNSLIGKTKELRLSSAYLDYAMRGEYNYSELLPSFQNMLQKFLPHAIEGEQKTSGYNRFNFDLRMKDLHSILKTFRPTLAIDTGFIKGSFDERGNELRAHGELGRVLSSAVEVGRSRLDIKTSDVLLLDLDLNDIYFGSKEFPYQLSFNSAVGFDVMTNEVEWESSDKERNKGELLHEIEFKEHGIQLRNHRSNFNLNGEVWQVTPSEVDYLPAMNLVAIRNFMINNSFQSLYLNGIASASPDDFVQLKLNSIDLKSLNSFLPSKHQFDGTMSGQLDVHGVLSDIHLLGSFQTNDLVYNQEKLGNVFLKSEWNRSQESINVELKIEQPQGGLQAVGCYEPSTDSLRFDVDADRVSLNFLSPLLNGLFKNIKGYASGNLLFHGHKRHLLIDGDLQTDEARIALNALNVNYHFNDVIKFRQDSIIFSKINIFDDEKHTGSLDGTLKHVNFNQMVYDLTMNSTNLMVMNTNSSYNEQFFGKAYARGYVRITGKGANVLIKATATTLGNTDVSFAPMSEEKAESYSFLSFIDKGVNQELSYIPVEKQNQSKSELNMQFNVTVTPDAKFQLVFNSKIGDVIQAKGKGSIQVNIDPEFNVGMYGGLEVTWGDYLFTLQNIFNKRFSIENGSSIKWAGDPFAAELDMKAIYSLKASLNDLIVDSYAGYDFSQRVPVNCYIVLQNELLNPTISFDIKFPTVEDRIQDELRQYMSTEEDMNRQILSLLLMGSFYTPEYLQGSYTGLGTSFMGTTTSELLSNQLSNWLSAISDNFDLGFNYRPGNSVTDDEVELALSTQLFNDRVTLNGNVSNNTNNTGSTNTNNNSAFVGDFDLSVALSKNGKLQLKAYNHSNNNIIYETSPYKQGVGFTYQEDFNRLSDLWRKIRFIFISDEKKAEIIERSINQRIKQFEERKLKEEAK